MNASRIAFSAALLGGLWLAQPAAAATTLLDQDFEAPVGFIDTSGGGDVSQQTVNSLYGDQPPGFLFSQDFTVETLNITGGSAFGIGYSDPAGGAGNFLIGLLSSAQDDRLGLSFDVGAFDFLNVSIDVTSIDLDRLGGPFVPGVPGDPLATDPGSAPLFRFSLFDNPGGGLGTGAGAPLSVFEGAGTASDRNVVDFTNLLFGLDASGSTTGEVILQIDLLSGGYAGFDNLVITADDAPPMPQVPAPPALSLLLAGLAGFALLGRRGRRA